MLASRCLKDMTGPLSNKRLTNYEPTVEEDRRGRDRAGKGGGEWNVQKVGERKEEEQEEDEASLE